MILHHVCTQNCAEPMNIAFVSVHGEILSIELVTHDENGDLKRAFSHACFAFDFLSWPLDALRETHYNESNK